MQRSPFLFFVVATENLRTLEGMSDSVLADVQLLHNLMMK